LYKVVFYAPGLKRVELGFMDARHQRDGAVDALHVAMEAPDPMATSMS
jgi:hypothetical protein